MVRPHERHGTAEWGQKGQSVKLIVVANRINTNYSELLRILQPLHGCANAQTGCKKVQLADFSKIANAIWSELRRCKTAGCRRAGMSSRKLASASLYC